MSNIIKQMVEGKLATLKNSLDATQSGIKANEEDLAEQKVRLGTIQKDIKELEDYLILNTFNELDNTINTLLKETNE